MATFGRGCRSQWPLDPSLTYLNHGTVGVTPHRVRQAQRDILDEIERQPSQFLLRELTGVTFGRPTRTQPRLREAAASVAAFLGARGEDLVFVDNATSGANAVLRSFDLRPGDEILVTDLGYGGVTNTAVRVARERGAIVTTAAVPYPVRQAEQILDACLAAVTPRTRLAVIDHIAAHSALIFPVRALADALHARGVAVLVDGAHAPGAIAVDLPALGADWYVANLHKWLWVPRSSGILWAAPERQADLHPVVTSWGMDQGMTMEFDLPGTRDPSAHLTAPAAIAYMTELGGTEGAAGVRRYNHTLAWQAGQLLADRWGVAIAAPESMYGPMITVPLPASAGSTPDDAVRVRDMLLFDKRIEAPISAAHGHLHVRVSAQIYNDLDDVATLARALAP